MFAVLFEVNPRAAHWEDYLSQAKMLRPELEKIDGFIDNIRYASLRRKGWILSLSSWRDEKSLVRWRVQSRHHETQQLGRDEILLDYHLRVGQLTLDSEPPAGQVLSEQRLDETEVGEGTTTTLVTASRTVLSGEGVDVNEIANWLGLDEKLEGLVSWDAYRAVLTPADFVLQMTWRDAAVAGKFAASIDTNEARRCRQIRIVRDYSLRDRREAPQFFSDVATSARS